MERRRRSGLDSWDDVAGACHRAMVGFAALYPPHKTVRAVFATFVLFGFGCAAQPTDSRKSASLSNSEEHGAAPESGSARPSEQEITIIRTLPDTDAVAAMFRNRSRGVAIEAMRRLGDAIISSNVVRIESCTEHPLGQWTVVYVGSRADGQGIIMTGKSSPNTDRFMNISVRDISAAESDTLKELAANVRGSAAACERREGGYSHHKAISVCIWTEAGRRQYITECHEITKLLDALRHGAHSDLSDPEPACELIEELSRVVLFAYELSGSLLTEAGAHDDVGDMSTCR